jgi:hypothetical protein
MKLWGLCWMHANVIDRIDRAAADGRAAVDLPFINSAVVNLETPTAMAAQGVRVVNWFAVRHQRMFAAASACDSEYSGSDTDGSDYNDNWFYQQMTPTSIFATHYCLVHMSM